MNTLDYFKQICKIPRESGNEEGMRQFILSWAKENNFLAKRDKTGNIIVYCDATPGFENIAPVALQGHMDMVCVKRPGSNHDFTKDPIDYYLDGDWLKAKDTTLGGDNGIAVAMIMALFTDPSAKHGKLEAIFTYNEETGMDGAFLLDESLISSRKLINLDSEEEGIIYIGCAGGIDYNGNHKVKYETIPEGWERVRISLSGLRGGHSGGEIHHQRLNAIKALARMIKAIDLMGKPFMLCEFNGGIRRNVIPSSADCIVSFPEECKKEIMGNVLKEFENLKGEFGIVDPDFAEEHHCSKCLPELANVKKGVCCKDSLDIINALYSCPHGVHTMSRAIEGIVETSDNLAITTLSKDSFHVEISVRSSLESAKIYLVNAIKNVFDSCGFEGQIGDGYPSWAPNPNSKLAAFCAKAWKDKMGKEPTITAIHAGLECGVINSKIPGMDSVSIGPDLKDVHSVNEQLSVSSTDRLYGFVKHLLEIIK